MSEARANAIEDASCACGCAEPLGAVAHAIAIALAHDDLDRAITLGLLSDDFEHARVCAQCTPACALATREARANRLNALAARERYRARTQRLQRRAEERAAQRAAAPAAAQPDLISTTSPTEMPPPRPALPSAAAAALARAKAKAAQRGPS